MKLYELTFMDTERGKIIQWKRNKREATTFINKWKRKYPLRSLLLQKRIDIPDDKQSLVDWLNATRGGL